ncbi:hypothetical protein [Dokdonella sp.]|uniref:hypothetical protein n=1 Tax=Dokdonella sp. TaxID=2291710 RepID=UPI0025C2BB48|nr:hypothetical protein [Dokdonella sp.]MBX3691117.1 hypothetical protein [Dokdonella sp.]MCW5566902.1 hypothetical protein [Dokdonella sp.]
MSAPAPIIVRHLRQSLLWPLRLVGGAADDDAERRQMPWRALQELGDASPWREHVDEYHGSGFHERHYNEFVSFLPYVQRFLYGEGRSRQGAGDAAQGSPMRVFRRHDLAALRVQLRPGEAQLLLRVEHVDLIFFFGVDIVLLNVELSTDDLPLAQARELMYRSGRAYPAGWDAGGEPLHCPSSVAWLDAQGREVVCSDAADRALFLTHVAEHRAPRIAAHWDYVMAPLVNHHSGRPGALRYRQIEYYRMPMMAYLAVDEPSRLTRDDYLRLALVTGSHDRAGCDAFAPADFEQQYCYDRFWTDSGVAPRTRYLCSGLSLVVTGDAHSSYFRDAERGALAQFRHQHFLLFLIAHFQKAALLMMSDQLAEALMALDVKRPDTVKRFKRQIRRNYVAFLSFTHRYWFHEISEQAHVKALFRMCTRHLGIDGVYAEVKERIHDMSSYLDADALRRQANTVVRLTVVTIFGLVGTITAGLLGMSLLAGPNTPVLERVLTFIGVLAAAAALTIYTIVKSKRLSDFLDVVSDERVGGWNKLRALVAVWRREPM